jgi:hypothetical protein
MNRIEATIGGALVAIMAGCTSAPVPVARDVPPTVSPRPMPRPVAAPQWQGCIEWPNDCDEGRAKSPNEIIREIVGRIPNGPSRSVVSNPYVPAPDVDVDAGDGDEVGEGPNPVKGNASANNGKGNYAWTGHADNGKGNGRDRK